MTERSHIEDVEFLLDVLDARPGTSVLAIEAGPASAVVAENVGPHGRVRVAPSVTRAHEFAQWEKFDRIYALDIPDLREDTAAAAALAPLLTDDGQLWVIDGAGPGEDTGTVSMTVSTVLARAGFAIVDILERGSRVAVWAAVGRRHHG
ncbi:hypothetical protein NVV99_07240 [Rhodococcus sp. PAE-6]|uniref:Uncharacterized protein n=1 Tax=Rhodococcus pyridinivorans TaxID=103816 RepID=A0A7M2XR26_9NOCA|nr:MULTISPECIES: hypothetical protein [Rhodococcus]MCT7290735.1 hypothetical protein [Rhodococcus sp. PAE-6]QOV99792.1 hypothetical protein INP59_05285 [Rhodococcus pyridinivorans]WMM73680.1 hypothetical protein RCF27_05025 [Rhodococcus pyridinivorans]